MLLKTRTILPGFNLALGYTVFYLSLIVLIPLSLLFFKASTLGWHDFLSVIFAKRTLAAYRLSFTAAFVASIVNVVFGFIIAWVLVRYDFFGKKIIDALIDLPFALPTAVAGIAFSTLYSNNGWLGQYLFKIGIPSAYNFLGITLVLMFIGLPFIVRTIEPVLQELDHELEDAAESLGASRWQTFVKVIFPTLLPSIITGFSLGFARTIGEYGSVVFIAGNMPNKTEIAPLLIITKLEEYDYAGATAIAVVMLMVSFLLLAITNYLQHLSSKKIGMS